MNTPIDYSSNKLSAAVIIKKKLNEFLSIGDHEEEYKEKRMTPQAIIRVIKE